MFAIGCLAVEHLEQTGPQPSMLASLSASDRDRDQGWRVLLCGHQCRPMFDAIGRQTFVVGSDPSQANAVKLCGNFMIAAMLEAFGEAYATLRKADVLPHTFLEVMSMLFGSPVYANYGRLIADQKFEPAGFALRLGLKDVRLVLQAPQDLLQEHMSELQSLRHLVCR